MINLIDSYSFCRQQYYYYYYYYYYYHHHYYYIPAGMHGGTVEGTGRKVAGSNPECVTGIFH